MGFLGGLGRGIVKGVTGGDNKMQLQDYLKLAGMVAAGATGNVPALIAMGASMAGDATGSKELSLAGDVASMATGVGAAAGAVGGASGAAEAVTGAADTLQAAGGAGAAAGAAQGVPEALSAGSEIMSPIAENAQILEAGSQFTPEMIQGAGEAGNVFGQGADIAGQMQGVENFVGPLPPSMGQGPSQFKMALKNVLGETADDRWENVGDLSGELADAAAQQEQPMEAPHLDWQQTEDVTNYTPTHLALQEYLGMQQNGGYSPSPYASQFNQYQFGG